MDKVEEFLQHHGVKGMRWGVRRYQPYQKGPGKPKGKFIKKVGKAVSDSRVGQEVRSAKRELSTLKTKANLSNMSTKDIKKAASRMQKENEMKRLTKTKVSLSSKTRKDNAKDKKDYRNRGRMSDQEVDRKLERLRAKDLLSQNANKASKVYVDAGKRVFESASALAVTYASTGGSITVDNVFDAIAKPREASAKAASKAAMESMVKKFR